MAGREPASPFGGANPGIAQVPVGGEVADGGPCERCPSAGFSQLRYDGLLQHVRADVEGDQETPRSPLLNSGTALLYHLGEIITLADTSKRRE